MSKINKITNNTLGVIIGLVVSIFWIFMGLDFGFKFGAGFDSISYLLTLGGYRHTIIPIAGIHFKKHGILTGFTRFTGFTGC